MAKRLTTEEFIKRAIAEAKAKDLTFVGQGKTYRYWCYRFNACGHKHEFLPSNIRRHTPRCNSCLQERLIEEAQNAGLTLLGKGKNKNYRSYQFKDCGHEQEFSTNNVRKNKNCKCNSCFQEKLKDEAQNAGLILLGDGKDFNHRLYQFNKCCHQQEISINNVRKKNLRCRKCLLSKLIDEANIAGLTLLGNGKGKSYRLYRFNDCLHSQEIQTPNVRRNRFRCESCFKSQLRNEANIADLKILGNGKSTDYRLYQFKDCKHEQHIRISHVRENKNFKCEKCFQNKLIGEANSVDLTLLGPGRDRQYRLYRFNRCGHKQEITTGSVRRDGFICTECGGTSRTLPSHVYLLNIQFVEERWLKLGYAKTIDTRIKGYGLPKSVNIDELRVLEFETGAMAHAFESQIHMKFRTNRLPISRMKKFHTKSGSGECYPIEMLDRLMNELS